MHSPFADPRLELAVRAAMPQDVLAQPLSSLTRLDAAQLGIRRLRGIEQLSELRWLDLSGNPLVGVTELGANTKLIRLSLAHTGTPTLNGLAGLPDLEDLDLYGSRVLSIDAVAGLPSLRSLDLGLCIVKQLDPLARLTKLESLTLGNPVLHIVRRVVFSTPEPIALDLTPIEQLHALRQLRLCGVQISLLARLAELVGLEELVLERCSLGGGLRTLPRLPRLELLSLAHCKVDDLAPLAELPRLRVLQLDEGTFGDLAALAGCESLESLSLREVKLAEHQIDTLLRQLPQLTSLRVGDRLIER
jgi:Leucine-rich repeat (LRR) protein